MIFLVINIIQGSMKNISKLIMVLLLVSVVLFTSACSKNESEEAKGEEYKKLATFTYEKEGISVVMEYFGIGDNAYVQTSLSEIQYSALGVTNAEEAKIKLASAAEQYKGLKGVENSIEYKENMLIEKSKIKFKEVEYEKIKKVPGMFFDSDPSENGVSVIQSGKMLSKQGFVRSE